MTTQEHKAYSEQVSREEQEMRKRYKKHIANGEITENDVIEFSVDAYRAMMRAFDSGDLDSLLTIYWVLKKYGIPQKLREKIDHIDRMEEQGYITQFRPAARQTE